MACPEPIQKDVIFNMGLALIAYPMHKKPTPPEESNLLTALNQDERHRNTRLRDLPGFPNPTWQDIKQAIESHTQHGLAESFLVVSLLHMVDETFRHQADETEHRLGMERHRAFVSIMEQKKAADSPENAGQWDHLMQPSISALSQADDRLSETQEVFRLWRSVAGERLAMAYPLGHWVDLLIQRY